MANFPRRVVHSRAMDVFAIRANSKTVPIASLTSADYKGWLAEQPKPTQAWLKAIEFKPDAGAIDDKASRRLVRGCAHFGIAEGQPCLRRQKAAQGISGRLLQRQHRHLRSRAAKACALV